MVVESKAIEANVPPIAAGGGTPVIVPTEIDYGARNAALEAEKARLIEESANYKLAYLKEKGKNKGETDESGEEDDDTRMRRIANETLANSRLAEIAREQDLIIKQALKENTELKQTLKNKANGIPTSVGSHTESQIVQDTAVTPEQLAAFKARGWTDKDIERYKRNIQKNSR